MNMELKNAMLIVGIAATLAMHAVNDNFQEALNCVRYANTTYAFALRQTKESIQQFLPFAALFGGALLTRRISDARTRGEAVLGACGAAYTFSRGIFEPVVGWGAKACSYLPFTFSRLKNARINKDRAWRNLMRIIHNGDVKVHDLPEYSECRSDADVATIDTVRAEIIRYGRQCPHQPVKPWEGPRPEELDILVDHIRHSGHYEGIGLPHGILLYGRPGTGKTHAAQWIAEKAGCELMTYEAASIFGKYVGNAAKKIRGIYAEAAARARSTGRPVIVFLDEADSIARRPSTNGGALPKPIARLSTLSCRSLMV